MSIYKNTPMNNLQTEPSRIRFHFNVSNLTRTKLGRTPINVKQYVNLKTAM